MAEIAPVADKVTSYFYALLFVRHPELRGLFPAAMDAQRDRLLKALLTAAEHMDNAGRARPTTSSTWAAATASTAPSPRTIRPSARP